MPLWYSMLLRNWGHDFLSCSLGTEGEREPVHTQREGICLPPPLPHLYFQVNTYCFQKSKNLTSFLKLSQFCEASHTKIPPSALPAWAWGSVACKLLAKVEGQWGKAKPFIASPSKCLLIISKSKFIHPVCFVHFIFIWMVFCLLVCLRFEVDIFATQGLKSNLAFVGGLDTTWPSKAKARRRSRPHSQRFPSGRRPVH